MSSLDDPVVKSIIEARVTLLFDKPFFGNLATRLELVDATSWCPTAATDGRKLYFNREFIKGLNKKELLFLLGHEVLHVIYDHLGRRGSRDPQLWNMANDYLVNYTLKAAELGTMPKGGLYDPKFTDLMTSEEVYNILKKNQVKIEIPLDMHLDLAGDSDSGNGSKSGKKGGQGDKSEKGKGQGGDEDSDEDGDEGGNGGGGQQTVTVTVNGGPDGPPVLTDEDMAQIRQEVKAALINAAQAVGAGNVPAGVARLIDDFTNPIMDWKSLLELHIQSSIKDDYTFARPSKRSWSINGGASVILPGQKYKDTVDVAISIDTSGSMTKQMLQDFLSEVKGIMETFDDFKLTLWTFDTKVYNPVVFTPQNLDEIFDYEPKGGGGTLFECNWEFMRDPAEYGFGDVDGIEDAIEPKKFVMFTDGYPCSTWGEEDYCDTLFVVHGNTNIVAPWGMTAYYVKDEAKAA